MLNRNFLLIALLLKSSLCFFNANSMQWRKKLSPINLNEKKPSQDFLSSKIVTLSGLAKADSCCKIIYEDISKIRGRILKNLKLQPTDMLNKFIKAKAQKEIGDIFKRRTKDGLKLTADKSSRVPLEIDNRLLSNELLEAYIRILHSSVAFALCKSPNLFNQVLNWQCFYDENYGLYAQYTTDEQYNYAFNHLITYSEPEFNNNLFKNIMLELTVRLILGVDYFDHFISFIKAGGSLEAFQSRYLNNYISLLQNSNRTNLNNRSEDQLNSLETKLFRLSMHSAQLFSAYVNNNYKDIIRLNIHNKNSNFNNKNKIALVPALCLANLIKPYNIVAQDILTAMFEDKSTTQETFINSLSFLQECKNGYNQYYENLKTDFDNIKDIEDLIVKAYQKDLLKDL